MIKLLYVGTNHILLHFKVKENSNDILIERRIPVIMFGETKNFVSNFDFKTK